MQRELVDWQSLRERYEGAATWLVCGGPSVRGFDFSLLGDTVAAINEIGRDIPNLNIWIGNDELPRYPCEFWRRDCLKLIRKEQMTLPNCELVNVLDFRSRSQQIGQSIRINENLFFDSDKVTWGAPAITRDNKVTVKKSVMLMALGVLYRMGFAQVRLIGCDWQATEENAYGHSHKEIDAAVVRKGNEQFRFMEQWFRQLRPMFEARHFEVLNCTDGGCLEVFERGDWRDYVT